MCARLWSDFLQEDPSTKAGLEGGLGRHRQGLVEDLGYRALCKASPKWLTSSQERESKGR